MTELDSVRWDEQSPDHDLIACVRDGDTDAFAVLYARHRAGARTVARQYLPRPADAEDVVSEAFAKVFSTLRRGAGPDAAFRAYLFTVVRRLSFEAVDLGRRVTPSEDSTFEIAFGPSASSEEPTLAKLESSMVAEAFRSLPERWQSALWYSEIEGLAPVDFAVALGLTANSAAALTYRAREGLRQAYLQHHLAAVDDPTCATVSELFPKYVRGGASRRDVAVVEQHLEGCVPCTALVHEIEDVSSGMRAVVAPLVLGTAGLGALGAMPALWGAAPTVVAGLGKVAGPSQTGAGPTAEPSGAAGSGGAAGGVGAGTQNTTLLWGVGALALIGVIAVSAMALGLFTPGTTTGSASPSAVTSGPSSSAEPPVASADGQEDRSASAEATPGADEPWADGAEDPLVGQPSETGATRPPVASAPAGPTAPADREEPLVDPAPALPVSPTSSPVEPSTPPVGPTDPSTPPAPVDPTDPPEDLPAVELSVELSSGTALVARQPSPVGLIVTNSGLGEAEGVSVDLVIPSSVSFVGAVAGSSFEPGRSVASFFAMVPTAAVAAPAPGWSCGLVESATVSEMSWSAGSAVVRCLVEEVPAGGDVEVILDLLTDRSGPVELMAQVSFGAETTQAWTLRPVVEQAPAALRSQVAPVAALRAGMQGYLAVGVTNAGEQAAERSEVVVVLPRESGLRWVPTDPGGALVPVGPTAAGWVCAVQDLPEEHRAVCRSSEAVDGDSVDTLLMPVAVAGTAAVGTAEVRTTTTSDGRAAPGAEASSVPISSDGLSAAAMLSGNVDVVRIAAPLGQRADLTLPEGATVEYAELTWSGADLGASSASALATVDLRGDVLPRGWTSLWGSPVLGASGASSYWARADVTAIVAGQTDPSRVPDPGNPTRGEAWGVTPRLGFRLPTDLVWSLTVVYSDPAAPLSTVSVLSGPSGGADTLALPGEGQLLVTGSVFTGAPVADSLVRQVSPLPFVADPLALTGRFVAPDLQGGTDGPVSSLGLLLTPDASVRGLAVVTTNAPDALVAQAPEQAQRDLTQWVSFSATARMDSNSEGLLTVSVWNYSGSPLTDLSVVVDLPPSVEVVGTNDCPGVPGKACRTLSLMAAGSTTSLTLQIEGQPSDIGSSIEAVATATDSGTGRQLRGRTIFPIVLG